MMDALGSVEYQPLQQNPNGERHLDCEFVEQRRALCARSGCEMDGMSWGTSWERLEIAGEE